MITIDEIGPLNRKIVFVDVPVAALTGTVSNKFITIKGMTLYIDPSDSIRLIKHMPGDTTLEIRVLPENIVKIEHLTRSDNITISLPNNNWRP